MFKKTRIASVVLAVATAPAAFAASEVALHGDFRGSVDHTSASGVGSGLNWQDNSSRFGIEASTTHQGLRAFVNYEQRLGDIKDSPLIEDDYIWRAGVIGVLRFNSGD